MELLTDEVRAAIDRGIVVSLLDGDLERATAVISAIGWEIYAAIPQKSRISFGRVHVVRELSEAIVAGFEAASARPIPR